MVTQWIQIGWGIISNWIQTTVRQNSWEDANLRAQGENIAEGIDGERAFELYRCLFWNWIKLSICLWFSTDVIRILGHSSNWLQWRLIFSKNQKALCSFVKKLQKWRDHVISASIEGLWGASWNASAITWSAYLVATIRKMPQRNYTSVIHSKPLHHSGHFYLHQWVPLKYSDASQMPQYIVLWALFFTMLLVKTTQLFHRVIQYTGETSQTNNVNEIEFKTIWQSYVSRLNREVQLYVPSYRIILLCLTLLCIRM